MVSGHPQAEFQDLARLAELIRQRNQAEVEITRITGRPAAIGHLGEYIASRIFKIALAATAIEEGIDGTFTEGPLAGRTVDIKWYAKREGILDVGTKRLLDFYLVLAGPAGPAFSSKGLPRPWLISSVHLFETTNLIASLRTSAVRVGIATSVRAHFWDESRVYPDGRNNLLPLTAEHERLLALFR